MYKTEATICLFALPDLGTDYFYVILFAMSP